MFRVGTFFTEEMLMLAGAIDEDIPHRIVKRLKNLLVEADSLRSRAETDTRIVTAEAEASAAKIR